MLRGQLLVGRLEELWPLREAAKELIERVGVDSRHVRDFPRNDRRYKAEVRNAIFNEHLALGPVGRGIVIRMVSTTGWARMLAGNDLVIFRLDIVSFR